MRNFLVFAATAPLSFLLIISSAVAQPRPSNPMTPPSVISIHRAAPTQPTGISLDVGMGSSSFQDIQAPVAASRETRVDGTSASTNDSSNHTGLLLSGRLAWNRQHSFGKAAVGLYGDRSNSSAPIGVPAASYTRIGIDAGTTWDVGRGFSLLSATELRRTMFRNTDNGHYLDAILLKAGVGQNLGDFSLEGAFALSPMSRFGYMQNSGSKGSGSLAETSSSLQEWSGKFVWHPTSDADLFLKFAQENISADVRNVGAYRNLGLDVADGTYSERERSIRLSTMTFAIGASRKF